MGLTNRLKLPLPDLTQAADGPDAFSDLAIALEDYFYDRVLPTGVTRTPVYYWGSGTTEPASNTAGLKAGDTYRHTYRGLMVWSGTAWISERERPVTVTVAPPFGNFDPWQRLHYWREGRTGHIGGDITVASGSTLGVNTETPLFTLPTALWPGGDVMGQVALNGSILMRLDISAVNGVVEVVNNSGRVINANEFMSLSAKWAIDAPA